MQIIFTDKKTRKDLYRKVTPANVRQVAAEVARRSTRKETRAQILALLENDLKRETNR